MFVDEVDIHIQAGDGGNGCMAFRREMRVPRGGPSGGDGGRGGSIFLVASAHQNTLVTYRFHPEFKAERGRHGEGSNCTGSDGADLILEVPPGTVAYELGEAAPVDPGILMGVGLFISSATAVYGVIAGGAALQSTILKATVPLLGDLKFVTSSIFDIGVYLIVIGLVLDVLRSMGAELDRQGVLDRFDLDAPGAPTSDRQVSR